jgi:hypothetical protein
MTERKDFHDRPSPRLRRRLLRFPATGEATHRPAEFMFAQEFANQIAKPTAQHTMARGITGWDGSDENAEPKRAVSYSAAQDSMRIIELENRCAGNRTVGSNPTLSDRARCEQRLCRLLLDLIHKAIHKRMAGPCGRRGAEDRRRRE